MMTASIVLIVLGSLLGAAAFTVFMLWVTMSILKHSEVYRGALDRYLEHPDVTRQIGSPVRAGALVNGRIKIMGQGGYARLTIPVIGPVGKGGLGVYATQSPQGWQYDKAVFRIDGGEAVTLEV